MIFAGKPTIDLPGLRQLTLDDDTNVWGAYPFWKDEGVQGYYVVFKDEGNNWRYAQVVRFVDEDFWRLDDYHPATHDTANAAWKALVRAIEVDCI